ncbi:MAG TPA: SDR family oxidoreductase [Candidatus Dormibacteraeota bacterium]|nr:SDR family oxidoreductase [Candidatus Dormibacteraeota bacterium]
MPRTVLITGASSGIGYELALLFARDGFDCVLTARRADRLEALAVKLREEHKVRATVIPADLADPASPERIFSAVHSAGLAVDVLVNNAGFPSYGHFFQLDTRGELNELQVNIVALTHLTRLFLPDMIARRDGRILNVASTAAFEPGPLMAVYYASKAYVLSFSQALGNELTGTGVSVTALCPGITRTGFQAAGAMDDSRLVQGRMADAASVALAGYRGLMARKSVVIPGFANKLVPLAVRLAPRSVVTRMVRRAQERVR